MKEILISIKMKSTGYITAIKVAVCFVTLCLLVNYTTCANTNIKHKKLKKVYVPYIFQLFGDMDVDIFALGRTLFFNLTNIKKF